MLADYVYINQLRNKITSTLLLDVKGAYNHMSKNRLLIILKDLAFPNSGLFRSHAVKFISYIDNITLSYVLTSPYKNVKILQLSKLIHFSIGECAKLASLILLDGTIVPLKQIVKWLGIYFNALLQFKEHITIRTTKAKSAFRCWLIANEGLVLLLLDSYTWLVLLAYPTIYYQFSGKAKHTQKTTYSTSKIWHYAKS
ncbi:hypothetical protein LHYA1_G009112 [Lachnellula hyalina]|uniref:Reverse transcriptase domain-containing protein n=1 Tax=Lachnellula hyalina TaxID=1316788 RepID=A0A8H8TVS9_9HELO|nr:uncharacterized protein LHYA1_G009112 [Lachnellula hyalina]TVY22237.1 hypothetical protein LHYA1_G009112 [Lachnellula hyalina]